MAINRTDFYDADYDNIKARLKDFLSKQTVLKDYNFEGSAISTWLNLVSYIIYYINTIANFVTNEMFIASSTLDANIYKHSYQLNYLPRRKNAPKITVTAKLIDSSLPVTIPAHTNIQMGSINLVTLQEYVINGDTSIDLYQGEIVVKDHIYEGADFETIILDDREEVDNKYFNVFVNGDLWTSVYEDKNYLNAKNYFIRYIDSFEVRFDQKGGLFALPEEGDKISVVYLKTNGSEYNYNSNSNLTFLDNFDNIENVKLVYTEGTYLAGGRDEEDFESIAQKAPLFFTSSGRCVTEDDYNYRITLSDIYAEMTDMVVYSGHKDIVDYDENPVEKLTSLNKLDKGFYIWSGYKKDYVSSLEDDVFSNYTLPNAEQAQNLYGYIDNYKFMQIFGKFRMPNILVVKPVLEFTYKQGNIIDISTIRQDIVKYLNSFEGFDKAINITDVINYLRNTYNYFSYVTGSFKYHTLSFKPLVSLILNDEVNTLNIGDLVTAGTATGFVSRIDVDLKKILVTRTSEDQFATGSVTITRGSETVLTTTITKVWKKIIIRLNKFVESFNGEIDDKLIAAKNYTEVLDISNAPVYCMEADNLENLFENATSADIIGYINYRIGYIEIEDNFTWADYDKLVLNMFFRNDSGYRANDVATRFETVLDYQDSNITYTVEN